MALIRRTITNFGDPLVTPDGALLTGVTIEFVLVDAKGFPVDAWDAQTHERVVGRVTAVTDEEAHFEAGLWPNSRGNIPTQYACRVLGVAGVKSFCAPVDEAEGTLSWIDFMLAGQALSAQGLSALNQHVQATSGAHAASAISIEEIEGLAANNVQAALEELSEKSGSAEGALLAENNLSDLDDAETARTNLGLGGAATREVGTESGTVAAGDDSRLNVAATTHAASSKSTPANADELPLVDSAASNGLKRLTWANLKAGIFTAWGALVNAGTSKATPADADSLAISDSASSSATKKLTWANLKTAIIAAILPTYTVATLPAAATAGARALAWVTDLGSNGALVMSTGSRWRPVSGQATLGQLASQVTGINNTDTVVLQALLPAGIWQAGDAIQLDLNYNKSGSTDTMPMNVRVGSAGTTGDQSLWSANIAANMRSGGQQIIVRLNDLTTAQRTGPPGQNGSFTLASATVAETAGVTISAPATNATYVSVSLRSSGTTDTVGVSFGRAILLTP